MLVSKHPVMAMKYIEEMGLFRVVFTFPGNSDHPIDDHCARFVAICLVSKSSVVCSH
jgi:hypothetical protein